MSPTVAQPSPLDDLLKKYVQEALVPVSAAPAARKSRWWLWLAGGVVLGAIFMALASPPRTAPRPRPRRKRRR